MGGFSFGGTNPSSEIFMPTFDTSKIGTFAFGGGGSGLPGSTDFNPPPPNFGGGPAMAPPGPNFDGGPATAPGTGPVGPPTMAPPTFGLNAPSSPSTASPLASANFPWQMFMPGGGGGNSGGGGGIPGVTPGNTPGIVPPSSSGSSGQPLQFTGPPGASGMTGIGKGLFAQNPIDPALTSQFFSWLQGEIGKGVSPFNLSTLLPSSGEATAPGQLNAPLTALLKEMQGIYGPTGQIGEMAAGGVDAVAPWQKMVDAMQRQIGQGAANLREQFNVGGNLASSPYGTAAADYQLQSNKDLNSLLGQMQFQGIQDQLQAGQQVQGAGQFMQGLDQQAIQNMLQEFIRTSPEYNPLLGMMFGAATTFPPVLQPPSGGGILGGAAGSSGDIMKILAALATMGG